MKTPNQFYWLLFLLISLNVNSFRLVTHNYQLTPKSSHLAAGKGFGNKINSDPKSLKKTTNDIAQSDPVISEVENVDVKNEIPSIELNEDKVILKTKMFQSKIKQEEQSLQDKITRLRTEEELIASDESVGAVPQLVADRMIKRIAIFFGIPVFGGLAIFVTAFFASRKYDLTLPPTIVAYATQFPFIIGLAGISYAILSASWDEETEGSALGFSEFKLNLERIREGFDRTKERAKLEDEIEKETSRLKRRG